MSDIVERLREISSLNAGEEVPDWICDSNGNWGNGLRVLVTEAADTIERLRSIAGKADVGPSFSELTDELRHQTPTAESQ